MTKLTIRLFISHSADDSHLTEKLIELIRAALNLPASAIRCTSVDGYRLPGGANTDEQLRQEVQDADAFIGIVSLASVRSVYVLHELGARWGAKKHLVPLLAPGAGPSTLGGPLAELNALRSDNTSQLQQLLEELTSILSLTLESPATYEKYLKTVAASGRPAGQHPFGDHSESRKARQVIPLPSRSTLKRAPHGRSGHSAPTVVIGDRRENPPETPGDFFAASASPRDITWLPLLGLPAGSFIWNDKVSCATADDQELPQVVRDRDLIIIGSPYCNLMARSVNRTAFFRFNLGREVLKDIARWEDRIRGLPRHSLELETVRLELGDSHDKLLMKLRGNGLVDPIEEESDVGIFAGNQHDYALLSVCAHPYSPERRAILVAGRHLPGTMTAVRMLADPDVFEGHPAGGIVKVTIPEGGWYERLLRCSAEWFTPTYDWDRLQTGVGRTSKLYRTCEIDDSEVQGYMRLRRAVGDDSLGLILRRMFSGDASGGQP